MLKTKKIKETIKALTRGRKVYKPCLYRDISKTIDVKLEELKDMYYKCVELDAALDVDTCYEEQGKYLTALVDLKTKIKCLISEVK